MWSIRFGADAGNHELNEDLVPSESDPGDDAALRLFVSSGLLTGFPASLLVFGAPVFRGVGLSSREDCTSGGAHADPKESYRVGFGRAVASLLVGTQESHAFSSPGT